MVGLRLKSPASSAQAAYAERVHMARKGSDPTLPSFAAAIDAKVRKQHYLESAFGVRSFSRLCRKRNDARAWLNSLGFPTAELYASDFPMRSFMQAAGDRERFVVKPVQATNAWGVAGLQRQAPGRWLNVLTGETHSTVELLLLLDEPLQQFNFPDLWLIEELLVPPSGVPGVLDEFKVYAFRGRCPLILQVRGMGEGRSYKWWRPDWTPTETGKYEGRTDPDLPPPSARHALVALAEQISAQIPAPFCRIDLYDTSRGPVVSELTPEPGAYHTFSAETDRALGVLWEQSEAELLATLRPPGQKEAPL